MSARRTVKILFYAINGSGVGHLSRLTSIARELRRILNLMEASSEIWFLTTSEAPQIAHEFPVFKIPSKTILRQSEGGQRAYASIAKVLISNIIASFRPDALILDTIPEGSFKEFLFVKDHARRCFFIYRERAEARSRSFQSHLGLYDRILIPESESTETGHRFPLPGTIRSKTRFIGRVHGFRPESARTKESLTQELGIHPQTRLIYIAAGGGGDPTATDDLDKILQALEDLPECFLLIGLGPLYRGLGIHGSNRLSLSAPEISQIFPALDLAISAAGYNTYEELLAAQVPSLFFAQSKGLDQQEKRIRMGVERGWHGWLKSLDPSVIRQEVHNALYSTCNSACLWREALANRPLETGSIAGAIQILDGVSDLENTALNRDAIHYFGRSLKQQIQSECVGGKNKSDVGLELTEAALKFSWIWIKERLPVNDSSDLLAEIRIRSQSESILYQGNNWIRLVINLSQQNQNLFLNPPDWRKFLRNFANERRDPEGIFRILEAGLERLAAELDTQSLRDMLDWWSISIKKDLSIRVWRLMLDWLDQQETPRLEHSRRVDEALEAAKNHLVRLRKPSISNPNNTNVEKEIS